MKHILFFLFLIIYFTLSILLFKDFGPSGDEWTEYRAAENLYRYIKRPVSYESIVDDNYHDKLDYAEGHHPLVTRYQRSYQLIQYVLNYKRYYEWDHLINLGFASLFFTISYFLFYKYYKSVWKAMIPLIFLFFTPRLVGHFASNNKDMPFALMYLASLAAVYFTSSKKIHPNFKIIILGFIFGITQTFRAIGFSIYFVYLFYYLYLWVITDSKHRINIKQIANFFLELFIIGIFSLFISASIFPWLGANLFMNLYTLLIDAKSFQNWNDTIFFAGKFLVKTERPWYYLFTWLFITTPIYILALLCFSLVFVKRLYKNKIYVLTLIGIVANLLLYITFQPVIYNGLRHFLFILPLIALLASVAFIHIMENWRKILKLVVIFLLVINMLTVSYNLITLHPYQYIYFNELVGGLKGAAGQYELDYWGATYKEATEWLVDNKELTHEDIIYACNVDYSVDYYSDKEFFMTYGYPPIANYTICDVENEIKHKFDEEIVHEVKRQGVVLNRIRKHTRTEEYVAN